VSSFCEIFRYMKNQTPSEYFSRYNHMPQGTLSCYAIHLEGHEGHQGTIR
jgi:hypothetical protein